MNAAASVCHGSVGQVGEIVIPDSVVELSEECFSHHITLRSVPCGESSKLHH